MSYITPPPRPIWVPIGQPRYSLFISHAWDYKGDYEDLVSLLNRDYSFNWNNLSVPEEKPLLTLTVLPKSYRFLVRQLDSLISKSDCVLVLAGMYVAYKGWIQSEIEAAVEFGKPIITVEPRGSERTPLALQATAKETVGWNTASITSAIQRCVDGAQKPLAKILPPPIW